MKKSFIVSLLALMGLLISACMIGIIKPVFSEKDAVLLPGLEGGPYMAIEKDGASDKKHPYRIKRVGERGYVAEPILDKSDKHFHFHLVKTDHKGVYLMQLEARQGMKALIYVRNRAGSGDYEILSFDKPDVPGLQKQATAMGVALHPGWMSMSAKPLKEGDWSGMGPFFTGVMPKNVLITFRRMTEGGS